MAGHDQDPAYVLAAGAVLLALCTITVLLRFFTRHIQRVKLGADDWLLIPALFMVIGCGVCLIVGVQLGVLGYPTPPPPKVQDPNDAPNWNHTVLEQVEWSFFLMQILAMGFTKLSFVFFFRRIFVTGGSRHKFDIVSIGAIIILVLWVLAFFLWFLFSCASDFTARWRTVNSLRDSCPTDIQSDLALAVSDVVTDVMVLFLPVPAVLSLHMSLQRKLMVLAIFALGTIAVVMSIVRLALFVNILDIATGVIQDPTADDDLLTTRSLYWSMLESGLALIACCLPTLYALQGKLRLRSSSSSRGYGRWLRSKESASEERKQSKAWESLPNDKDGSIKSSAAIVPSTVDANNMDIESYPLDDLAKLSHDTQETRQGEA